jgi:glycosyltransferase involved in cell wall biosynthesis
MQSKKILFLYTELAGYFLSCVAELLKEPGVEVHIVRWPVNNEAPFDFEFSDKLKIYERKSYSREQLITLASTISPDIIYCSGWVDKDYLAVCRQYRNSIPVMVGLDNHWKGTLKQRIACMAAKVSIHRCFNYCWVPGAPQFIYAQKLGFKKENILQGFYSADVLAFQQMYEASRQEKEKRFPKRFIYVGRYYAFKGVQDLWEAFIEMNNEGGSEWELWCLGKGDIEPVSHPKIKHFGFVQPSQMSEFIGKTGVFVLPSHFEPWGVVVHEFAAAGFPLICSDEVGAATAFIADGYNGYIYEAGNKSDLKKKLKEITSMSDHTLLEMGTRSIEKAEQVTPAKWVRTLLSVLNVRN